MNDHTPKGSLWLHDAMQIVGKALVDDWTGTELLPRDSKPWPPMPIEGDPDQWMQQLGEGLYTGKPPEAAERLRKVAGWIERWAFRERLGLWSISESDRRLRTLPAADFLTPEGRTAIATGHFWSAPVFIDEDDLAKLLADAKGGGAVADADGPKKPPRRAGTREATVEAIRELWPKGVPSGLRAAQRNEKVENWFKSRSLAPPSPRSINRALEDIARAN